MIHVHSKATTLAAYYADLVAGQTAAHGPDYTAHHACIRECRETGAESYAELGVNQGATLACALLAGFERVVGVDIALAPFLPAEGLFRAYVDRLGKHLIVRERDSRLPLSLSVDFLLIDSRHTVDHLRDELRVHGPHVRRFILLHDTLTFPYLGVEAGRWAERNGWTVHLRSTCGHGHTLLSRG